jgi:2-polyprenyl-6-methoxyphenol hydroxylase-like FAD-dependent oxidoreductase
MSHQTQWHKTNSNPTTVTKTNGYREAIRFITGAPPSSRAATLFFGDAAACVSLMAGQGSLLAMAEAYMLAGELRRCGGDYGAASGTTDLSLLHA